MGIFNTSAEVIPLIRLININHIGLPASDNNDLLLIWMLQYSIKTRQPTLKVPYPFCTCRLNNLDDIALTMCPQAGCTERQRFGAIWWQAELNLKMQ